MAGVMDMPPEPVRRAAEQQAAEERAAQQRAETEDERVAKQRAAAEQLAAQRWNEEIAEGVRKGVESTAAIMSSSLVKASNSAAAVLETDAAYSNSVYNLPFFQEQAQAEQEQYLIQMLTAAGRGMLDSFTDLLCLSDVWDRVAHSGRTLGQELARAAHPFRFRMELAELLTQHIPELLLILGYRSPPPSEEWTDLVQNSVRRLLTSQNDARSDINAARARQELIFFTHRLRALVEAAEESLTRDEKNDESRFDALRHSLRTAVSGARNRAIPTALAAGASAAIAGVAGGPAGMGIAFLSGGAASLLGSATEAAAQAWLADAGHEDAQVMSPASAVRADVEALDECIGLLTLAMEDQIALPAEEDSATSATIESIHFIIRRGVFQTLQDAADSTVPIRQFLWDWSKDLLSRLDEKALSADEAHQIVDRARAVLART